MSLSGSRVGYKHRVTIQRNSTGSATDDFGDAVSPDWDDHIEFLPCRAWTNAAREPVDDDMTVVFEDRRISVAVGTDVTEADRILEVTDKQGNTIFEGPMSVEGITRHTDHLELAVERIR